MNVFSSLYSPPLARLLAGAWWLSRHECHVALRIEQLGFLGCIYKLYGWYADVAFCSRGHSRALACIVHDCKKFAAILDRRIFGTVYIVASIMLLPRLGAMTVIALLITVPMLASVALDHLGLLGSHSVRLICIGPEEQFHLFGVPLICSRHF